MFKVGEKYELISDSYRDDYSWTTGRIYTVVSVNEKGQPSFITNNGVSSLWRFADHFHGLEYFKKIVSRTRKLPEWF
jgi:hypothetical protein